MARRNSLVVGIVLISVMLAGLATARPITRASAKPLVVLTGPECDIAVPQYVRASEQALFDAQWVAHRGERVQRAGQGWPLTPQVDFDACEAVFIFGGDGINANGYRVLDVLESPDRVTVRYERMSYQTMSIDGPDRGVAVRPWAMLLLPKRGKTIALEENVQGIIGREPVWKQRATLAPARDR